MKVGYLFKRQVGHVLHYLASEEIIPAAIIDVTRK
jgi:hypothetical protein